MERQLLQRQKMEAVGTLAAGIAHNFNNLLMNIMGLTGLILSQTDAANPAYGDLKLIEQEVIKGAGLTKQLLSFGRGGKFAPAPLGLNALVSRTAKLFGRTRSEVTISQRLASELPAVDADEGQLEQVLLNLLVNAWQAMSGQGEIVLASRPVRLAEDFCQLHKRSGGLYVHLMVADSGSGMDPATVARIFEPFFTTKEKGEGTGLGLATVYAIISRHRGIITVESEVGRGTVFHLYLPVSEKAAAPARDDQGRYIRGSGDLLLVDDDESIRAVGQRMLRQLGYQVTVAAGGAQALEIYQAGERFALVILDIVMPGMGGGETYEKIKEIDPKVKVLLASGYSLDGEAQKILAAGARGFIQKPYRLDALSQKIAEILGSEQ